MKHSDGRMNKVHAWLYWKIEQLKACWANKRYVSWSEFEEIQRGN